MLGNCQIHGCCGITLKFVKVAQIRKFCESRDALEKFTVLLMSDWLCCRRAVAQRCPVPAMHNLISVGGQHQGLLTAIVEHVNIYL